MASEEESITTAAMAEDAAERARGLILALHRRGGALDVRAVADAVADGARRGATEGVSGSGQQLPATMTRTDADMYAAAAAAGAVLATLDFLLGADGSLNAPFVKEDGTAMLAALAGARVGATSGNYSLVGKFGLAFSVAMAIVSVFIVAFLVV